MLALVSIGLSRIYPFLSKPGLVLFPKMEFNFSKASLVQITNLPFLILYFLFLTFPKPGLIFLVSKIVASSSSHPRAYKIFNNSLVLEICK